MLKTRLHPPPPPSLSRPRLEQPLKQNRIALVLGPPGAGKTSLLAAAHAQQGGGWIALQRGDDLWSYLQAALQVPAPDLSTLLNGILDSGQETNLFIDDVHVLESHHLTLLESLIFQGPRNLRLFLSSRKRLPLPVARLRIQGDLAVVTPKDLCFTLEEARALGKSEEEWTKSLGWAAGLVVGSDPEYLQVEVFEPLHRHLQETLLDACVTEVYDGPHKSELEDRFLVDTAGRLHPMLAEFVRSKFSPAGLRELHEHWSEAYASRGEWIKALEHALQAESWPKAAHWLQERAEALLLDGKAEKVGQLIRMFPPAWRRQPYLVGLEAEVHEFTGYGARAASLHRRAHLLARAAGERNAALKWAERLALGHLRRGSYAELVSFCQQCLEDCPEDDPVMRSLFSCWTGVGLCFLGQDFPRAHGLLSTAFEQAFCSRDEHAQAWTTIYYCGLYLAGRGEFEEADLWLTRAIEQSGPVMRGRLVLYLTLIRVIAGRMEAAREAAASYREAGQPIVTAALACLDAVASSKPVPESNFPPHFVPWYNWARLRSCLSRNDLAGARRVLMQLGEFSGYHRMALEVCRAETLIRCGHQAAAEEVLHKNLELCQQAQARFWEQQTLALFQQLREPKRPAGRGTRIQIRAFGELRLYVEGRPVDYNTELSRLGVRLLKLLLSSGGRALTLERILELLWPHLCDQRGRRNFSVHVSALRKVLGHPDAVLRRGDCFSLNYEQFVSSDVLEFENAIKLGRRKLSQGDIGEAAEQFAFAESRRTAPFLEHDLYEDWILAYRHSLDSDYRMAVEWLADRDLAAGHLDSAMLRYRFLLDDDPSSEQVFLKLCRVYSLSGDPLAIRRELQAYKRRLRESGGLEPMPYTVEMVQNLMAI